jgi:ribosomal protein S18 acetylase RimI-like enzyme
MTEPAILRRLETYYDAVPRRRADPEDIGPFTLFVSRAGWPYYARPRLGDATIATEDGVRRVLDRQRSLGVPLSFEWVSETTPQLEAVVRAAGLDIQRCPLLVLEGEPHGAAGAARMLGPDDRDDLALSRAAIDVAFGAGGTQRGDEGIPARDAAVGKGYSVVDDLLLGNIASGAIRVAACYAPDRPVLGPVGGGSHSAVDDVTEIAGVGVLPAFRRRGLAAAVTFALARDALDAGVSTVFCSAQSDDVARVYEGIGFRRTATACIATLKESPAAAG